MRAACDALLAALARIQGLSHHEREMVRDFITQRPRATGRSCEMLVAKVPTLAGRDFGWPEFDRWQTFFAARDMFPVRWDGLQHSPPARTPAADAYQRRKLDLLLEWLDALARRSAVVAHYAKQGLGARIARQDARDTCAVCAPFAARQVTSGDDDMPPFHPGCRCVVLAVHAARGRTRTRGYPRAAALMPERSTSEGWGT